MFFRSYVPTPGVFFAGDIAWSTKDFAPPLLEKKQVLAV